jgi:hypothetical protein
MTKITSHGTKLHSNFIENLLWNEKYIYIKRAGIKKSSSLFNLKIISKISHAKIYFFRILVFA